MNPWNFDVASDDKIILTLVKLKRFTSTSVEHLANIHCNQVFGG